VLHKITTPVKSDVSKIDFNRNFKNNVNCRAYRITLAILLPNNTTVSFIIASSNEHFGVGWGRARGAVVLGGKMITGNETLHCLYSPIFNLSLQIKFFKFNFLKIISLCKPPL